MATIANSLNASVQPKKGHLYAVIQVKEGGKPKSVWRSLGLTEGANPSKVKKAYRDVVSSFEREYYEKLELNGKTESDLTIYDYMHRFLEKVKSELQINTYNSYRQMIEGKIKSYFSGRNNITVGNIKPKDITDFYDYLGSFNVKPNTIIHYHVVLHRAFKQAFKEELIEINPFDRIDRPKNNRFVGETFSEEEMHRLIECARTDAIYPAIMFAGIMGLRRSEALGVRWSRIDFETNAVLLDTKIVEYEENGKTHVEPVEEMKNTTSRRTLIIPSPIVEMLLTIKERQDINRKLFKESYNPKYNDYVCTDGLGNLIKPSHVTQHFSDLLKKYKLRHIRFHDLRHTCASLLINKGVPLINVSNTLGHSTISTTANIYGHLDMANKQSTASIMNEIFGESKSTKN